MEERLELSCGISDWNASKLAYERWVTEVAHRKDFKLWKILSFRVG